MRVLSKTILEGELNRAGAVHGVDCGAESRSAYRSNRRSEVCTIQRVEELRSEAQSLPFRESEIFIQRHVPVQESIRANRVSAYGPVLTADEKRLDFCGRIGAYSLPAVTVEEGQSVCGGRSIGQISVQIRIDRYVQSERSEEHTSELQSRFDLVCRLLLEKKKKHV